MSYLDFSDDDFDADVKISGYDKKKEDRKSSRKNDRKKKSEFTSERGAAQK